ncbi:hypothetical protein G6698_06535 [Polynucleobacter paneuropaeus]|nr:hypothetical protein [Polynucleobacter paneuropaeus]MBT8577345.1 hypothetical protein [Polynucleobacter paneuropaeus]
MTSVVMGESDVLGLEDRIAIAMIRETSESLKRLFWKHAHNMNTKGALLVSAELTARGIAPYFRFNLDEASSRKVSNIEANYILMIADLQWIVASYPKHQTNWDRAQPIFNPGAFLKTADYLFWDGIRSGGQVTKALGLTKPQQLECCWIKPIAIGHWQSTLMRQLPAMRALISEGVRSKDRRAEEFQNLTVRRRTDLWLCSQMANRKPQRTADYYRMLTGEKLTRSLVAKQLGKIPKKRRTSL